MDFLSNAKRRYRIVSVVVPVDFRKRQVMPALPEPKQGERKSNTAIEREARQHADRAEQHGIPMHMLLDRFASKENQDAVLHRFNRVMKQKHDEPYWGHDPHTRFQDDMKGRMQQVVPFPLPVIVKDLKGILGKGVPNAVGPDPFMWMDSKYGATKAALKQHQNQPLEIHTRSDLVAHDDYLALLNPKYHKIFIHLFTDDEAVARALEPGMPSVQRRLTAAKKLKDAGRNVTIVLDTLPDVDAFTRKTFRNVLPAEAKDFKTLEHELVLSQQDLNRLKDVLREHRAIEVGAK